MKQLFVDVLSLMRLGVDMAKVEEVARTFDREVSRRGLHPCGRGCYSIFNKMMNAFDLFQYRLYTECKAKFHEET